nr:antibiotic biosynthesis monooxygenase [Bradyrhizobium icense]
MAKHMSELVQSIAGYISHKGFVAEDGERVTIVEFESEEALREWRIHPDHAKAKRRGIESFFSDYKFQICNVIRERNWTARSRDPASV